MSKLPFEKVLAEVSPSRKVLNSEKILISKIEIDIKAIDSVRIYMEKFYHKKASDYLIKMDMLDKVRIRYPHCICYLPHNSWDAFIIFNEDYDELVIHLETKGKFDHFSKIDDFVNKILIGKIAIKKKYIKSLKNQFLYYNKDFLNLTTKKCTNIIVVIGSILAVIFLDVILPRLDVISPLLEKLKKILE